MATYTSVRSGVTSDINPLTNPWGNITLPTVGDKVVIASGHTVTIDGTVYWGDDTGSAITINGTLSFSRVNNTQLTIRGGLSFGASGRWDQGTEANPIPAGIASKVFYNDSAAISAHKYTFTLNGAGGWSIWGAAKTLFTQLKTAVAANATEFELDDISGWSVGDWVFYGPPDNSSPTQVNTREITAITPGSGTTGTITVAAITTASSVGRYFVNLSRNIRIVPVSTAAKSRVELNSGSAPSASVEAGYVECVGAGVDATSSQRMTGCILNLSAPAARKVHGISAHNIHSVSAGVFTASTYTQPIGLLVSGNMNGYSTAYMHSVTSNSRGLTFLGAGQADSPIIGMFSVPIGQGGASSGKQVINNPLILGQQAVGNTLYSGWNSSFPVLAFEINGGAMIGFGRIYSGDGAQGSAAVGSMIINGFDFGASNGNTSQASAWKAAPSGAYQNWELNSCTFPPQFAITRATALLNTLGASSQVRIKSKNNDPTVQERYTTGGKQIRDNTVFKRSPSSMRFDCWYNTPTTYSLAIKVSAGQTINLRGAMRYNTLYGTTAPPSVTISGLGITPVVATCPTTGADTWHDYSLSATNPKTYSGEFTVTYTGQSAALAEGAYCYFDGVTDAPWVESSRHFGYVFDSNAYRTADPLITLTESAALALPVTFDHASQTMTVAGSVTLNEIYQAATASLSQTANLGYPVFLSTGDGVNFSSSYNLVLNGAITGSGTLSMPTKTLTATGTSSVPIAHNAGTFTQIAVTGLVIGSRVQIYDVTNNIELYNDIVVSTNISLNANWTTNRTIRLRATYCAGLSAKLPVLQTSVLTGTGATFLVSQAEDAVYAANGVDGSTVTEFTADFTTVLVEVSDIDGATSVQRLYAWYCYQLTVPAGIAGYFGAAIAEDTVNYRINASLINLKIKNMLATPAIIVGARMYRDDGASIFEAGMGPIQLEPGKAYVAQGATPADVWNYSSRTITGGGLTLGAIEASTVLAKENTVASRLAAVDYTVPDNLGIAAIKAKTDNLPSDPASNTQVASRLAAVDYTVPDNLGIAAIKAKTDTLLSAAETAAAVWDHTQ